MLKGNVRGTMVKHAYLILCHTDFSLLCTLIHLLDDARNDIYVHIDQKATFLGCGLKVKNAGLHILEQRIDVRWGDYSMVQAELSLFEAAHNTATYEYYHLLSGTDLPLKSQDYIHEICGRHSSTEYIGFSGTDTDKEATWRAEHYFLFSGLFRSKNILIRLIRRLVLALQDMFLLKRHIGRTMKKGPQWCSVTHEFVTFLLQNKDWIERTFSHTYCPDELFIQTICWNSCFRDRVYDINDEFRGCMRYIKWTNGSLQDMTPATTNEALLSDRWFARKFSSADSVSVEHVLSSLSRLF